MTKHFINTNIQSSDYAWIYIHSEDFNRHWRTVITDRQHINKKGVDNVNITQSKLAILKSQWQRKQALKNKTVVGVLILRW